jgi:hypothetical protein
MSNELLFAAVAVGIVIALLLANFTIASAPASTIRQRVGRLVHEADPDLLARVSLEELQRPAGPVRRTRDAEVGR